MNYTVTKMEVESMKITFDYSGFADIAATSKTMDLPTPPNIYLLDVFVRVNTAFAGTVTVPQAKVGFSNFDDMLVALQSIATAGQLKSGRSHQVFCQGMASPVAKNQAVRLTIQNTTGNLSAYTAGELEVVLVYVKHPRA